MTTQPSPDALRTWAKGVHTSEAATELLLRAFGGRLAGAGHPWIHRDDDDVDWWWIEWDDIPPNLGALSGGERRLLMIVASIGGAQVPESLGELISGLDRSTVALVLAAVSHAAGTQEHREYLPSRVDDSGTLVIDPSSPRVDLGPLYPWPDQEEPR